MPILPPPPTKPPPSPSPPPLPPHASLPPPSPSPKNICKHSRCQTQRNTMMDSLGLVFLCGDGLRPLALNLLHPPPPPTQHMQALQVSDTRRYNDGLTQTSRISVRWSPLPARTQSPPCGRGSRVVARQRIWSALASSHHRCLSKESWALQFIFK